MIERRNGWDEWRRHVLAELQRLNDALEKQNVTLNVHIEDEDVKLSKVLEMIQTMQVSFATLGESFRLKSGAWGAMAAIIPVVIGMAFLFFRGKL